MTERLTERYGYINFVSVRSIGRSSVQTTSYFLSLTSYFSSPHGFHQKLHCVPDSLSEGVLLCQAIQFLFVGFVFFQNFLEKLKRR